MVTFVSVFSRPEGKTVEEFRTWLLTQHAPIVAQLPGLRHYVIRFANSALGGGEPETDAVTDLSWDDAAAMEAALASPIAREMAADSAPWLGKVFSVVVEEHVVVP